MYNFFGDKNKTSGEYLADELKKGYKATQYFFMAITVAAGLFFILEVLPTLL